MGLLDDAIREHLELKRRHGADPGEVARLEREAFGPLRREAGDAAAVAQEERPLAPPAPDLEYEDDDLEYEADVLYEDASPAGPEPRVEEVGELPVEPLHEPAAEHGHEPPAAPAHEPPPPPRDSAQQATAEFSIEDAEEQQADEPEEGDELLEETPEFLQETPEHDRLWFEQRPPRDFDF
jgi:hypothetical protein